MLRTQLYILRWSWNSGAYKETDISLLVYKWLGSEAAFVPYLSSSTFHSGQLVAYLNTITKITHHFNLMYEEFSFLIVYSLLERSLGNQIHSTWHTQLCEFYVQYLMPHYAYRVFCSTQWEECAHKFLQFGTSVLTLILNVSNRCNMLCYKDKVAVGINHQFSFKHFFWMYEKIFDSIGSQWIFKGAITGPFLAS